MRLSAYLYIHCSLFIFVHSLFIVQTCIYSYIEGLHVYILVEPISFSIFDDTHQLRCAHSKLKRPTSKT